MQVGLYFGSFNPIHTGHLIIANHVLNERLVEQVWFVVSPQNPLKGVDVLLKARKRLGLARKATKDDKRLWASDVEFHLPKPSYSINTLTYLLQKHPEHTFSIIMGSDSFAELEKWKDFQAIVEQYRILVYPRPRSEVDNKLNAKIEILHAPLLDISSTLIRELITNGKSIRYMVPEKVRKEIEKKEYYRK